MSGPGFGSQPKECDANDPKSGGDHIDAMKPAAYAPKVTAQEAKPSTGPSLPKGITLVNEFYDNKYGRA